MLSSPALLLACPVPCPATPRRGDLAFLAAPRVLWRLVPRIGRRIVRVGVRRARARVLIPSRLPGLSGLPSLPGAGTRVGGGGLIVPVGAPQIAPLGRRAVGAAVARLGAK